ncbi:nucleoside hydrolase [Zunongwangia sp. F260]|uniref:Nucleoside hydrolase n=1 Tax=Autumnicola lenta TaxID=3075593 RepID=A0ABU3CNS4_9FLAO|nr:nucleoside hydrolase [Zunongwangia sp. F260]MDT0648000.1 nucleoside hydrolase [Zunongwangia sp. F260]
MTDLKFLKGKGPALAVIVFTVILACGTALKKSEKNRIIFDTDANNELDDQHALAYLFFNGDHFDLAGVTVNATFNGGDITEHYKEAERVLKLSNIYKKVPLLAGANKSFEEIRPGLDENTFDGQEAVDFIINEAHKVNNEKLILMPVGKLTNIALALEKDPSIANKVRIVWLGSNYPEPGEYNQVNDTVSMNYILNTKVPFEMVTVRYGKTTGTNAVTANREEIGKKMPGLGPEATRTVTGRHGGTFRNFGDYSVNLFKHIDSHDEKGTRALFDMAAVAIVKNPGWAEKKEIPAPVLIEGKWVERPGNMRTIMVWENFNKEAIMEDFYSTMRKPVLVKK